MLPPLAVHQLFNELDAVEFDELRVLFTTSIEGHADLPGAREDIRILNGGFIPNDIRAGPRVALDDMQRVAVEVPRTVEPRLVVESLCVDDERLAFPAANRLPHPRVELRRPWIFEK